MSATRSPPGSWRLLLPAGVGWIATIWLIQTPGTAQLTGFVAGAIGVLVIIMLARQRASQWRVLRTFWGLAAIALACLVLLSARVWVEEQVRADPPLTRAAETGEPVRVRATLFTYPASVGASPGAAGARVAVAVDGQRGAVPVLAWFDAAPTGTVGPGSRVTLTGRVRVAGVAQREAFTMNVSQVEVLPTTGAWNALVMTAAQLRAALLEVAGRVDGAELVPGFAVGDTSLVSPHLAENLRESSLTHLTAVSGANCALVIGAVVWVCARCRLGRRSRLLVAGAALVGFLIVVGPDPSVQRAAVMATVVLVSSFGGRRASALPALAIAVLVLLLVDPWQALQPGFSLSVAATAGILFFAGPMTGGLHERFRFPKPLATAISVAVAAQVACGPILMLLQPGLSVSGVLANVLAAPAAPLGTGIGLLALLASSTGALGETITHLLVVAASLPARWVAGTAQVIAELPFSRWPWPAGLPGALLLAGLEVALFVAWAIARGHLGFSAHQRRPTRAPWQPPPQVPWAVRTVPLVLVAGAVGCTVAFSGVAPLAARIGVPNDWLIVACDVGQGDALLLRNPASPMQVMLVDTGGDPDALLACLERFGVDRIHLLVLTHDDADHVGALGDVVSRSDAALIAPPVRGIDPGERTVVQTLTRAGVPMSVGGAGLAGTFDEAALVWQVLAPPGGRSPGTTNAASLVLRVEVAGVAVLLLADTGEAEQRGLAALPSQLAADVVKVSHHGSRDHDRDLPERVGATWALVSVGAGNRYGHPVSQTLDDFAAAGSRVLRTDLSGSLALVRSADGALWPWAERGR